MWSIQETTCPYKPVDSHQTEKLAISTERFDWIFNRIMWFCVFCGTEGLLQDCRLPPKKLIGTNNQEFTESKREQFETYLQVTKFCVILKWVFAMSRLASIASFAVVIKLGLVASISNRTLKLWAWSICNLH